MYLALPRSHGKFQQNFSVLLLYLGKLPILNNYISLTGLSPSTAQLSRWFCYITIEYSRRASSEHNLPFPPGAYFLPRCNSPYWSPKGLSFQSQSLPEFLALPRSLATTKGITCLSLFLWLLRCFTSPRSRLTKYYLSSTEHYFSRVSPFGNLGL